MKGNENGPTEVILYQIFNAKCEHSKEF